MPLSVGIVPQYSPPYNVRIYQLGSAREGVFLRRVCRRKVSPAKEPVQGEEVGPLDSSTNSKSSPNLLKSSHVSCQAGKRASTRLRRLVEANSLSVMVTVTFDTAEVAVYRRRAVVGDLGDWEVAREHFARFCRRVKRHCKAVGLRYDLVGVEEVQKRGVQHFHFATALLFPTAVWDRLWGYGYVKVSGGRSARRREARRPGSEVSAVAAYISKYLGKGLDRAAGEGGAFDRRVGAARYHRSRSLQLPFDECLIEPGDISAFEELMTAGGYAVTVDPRRIEKEGTDYGWWCRSERSSGADSRPAEGQASAPNLKDMQVVTMQGGEGGEVAPELVLVPEKTFYERLLEYFPGAVELIDVVQ